MISYRELCDALDRYRAKQGLGSAATSSDQSQRIAAPSPPVEYTRLEPEPTTAEIGVSVSEGFILEQHELTDDQLV